MVNKKELAICKRRGHDGSAYSNGWTQCKWCGIWRRTVSTIEERETEPPEEETAAFQAACSDCGRPGFPSQETIPAGSSFARVNAFCFGGSANMASCPDRDFSTLSPEVG